MTTFKSTTVMVLCLAALPAMLIATPSTALGDGSYEQVVNVVKRERGLIVVLDNVDQALDRVLLSTTGNEVICLRGSSSTRE